MEERLVGSQGIYIVSSLGSNKCYPLAVLRRKIRDENGESAPDRDICKWFSPQGLSAHNGVPKTPTLNLAHDSSTVS